MHTRVLIDLAALLATHAKTIVQHVECFPNHAIEQYWTASKCRQDRWWTAIKANTVSVPHAEKLRTPGNWLTMKPVLEEILTGEVLTRVWSALVRAHERLRGTSEIDPILQSVYLGHLEARNRTLNLMVYGQGFQFVEAVALNQLRRRCERWTDLLLGQLAPHIDIAEFAFEKKRAIDFADDLREESKDSIAWQIVIASLRAAFQRGLAETSPNRDLNEQIAQSVISCIPSELYDSTGLMKSLWLVRMNSTAEETQGMIDEYLALDDFTAGRASRRFDVGRTGDNLPRF